VTSQLPVLLFLVPFVAALVIAAVGPFAALAVVRGVALAALASTAAVALSALPRVLASGALRTELGGWPPPIGIELVLDPLSACLAVLVTVVALVVVAGTGTQLREELPGREPTFLALALMLVAGLLGIIVTGDLFNLFVHIEVASLSAYALVAAGSRGAPRAGLRYLIIGSFGASLYLAGVGFLYGATGTLNIADIATRLGAAEPRLVLVGGLLIVVGLSVKMALYPLHLWMPSAYARGPSVSASLMAPLVTKVSVYALLRLLFWVFGDTAAQPVLLGLLAWVGAAAIVVGGAMAFVQADLRRLLAYSSVGQMGVVVLGIGLANGPALTGAVLHIANDALMKGALFLAAGVALLRFGVREVQELHRLRGRAPWTSAAITVSGLSLVGVPPLGGFFGKWYVLNGALQDGRWPLVLALVAGSLASIGYVFRILERLYFAAPPPDEDRTREGDGTAVGASVVLAALVLGIGLWNAVLVRRVVEPGLPVAIAVVEGRP
jgi:multicomponent Na+:H+ antiporter subunit D